MRCIAVALILLALVSTAAFRQAPANKPTQEQQTPGQIPSIVQINEPIRLRLSSTEPIPNANHLVNLSFSVELNAAKPIRSFRVHFEQEFEDQKITTVPIVVTSEMTVEDPADHKSVTFSCGRNAKAKVWVSVVEFADGTIWKADLSKLAETQGKIN